MISKILLAVDGSQNAQRATDVAAELAGKLDVRLVIVHVLMRGRPPAELVRMAEVEHLVEQAHAVTSPGVSYVPGTHVEILSSTGSEVENAKVIAAIGDKIVARAKTRSTELGVKDVTTSVRLGDYAEEILTAAADNSADMIVVGSRGLGTIRSTLLGSVSQKVIHHAKCSVLTVR